MIAQSGADPVSEIADVDARQAACPALRNEAIVDVIDRTIAAAIAPVEGRLGLLALRDAAGDMVRALEAEAAEIVDRRGVVVGMARSIPIDIVVEVAGDDDRRAGQEPLILAQCAAQGSDAVLEGVRFVVTGPDGEQAELDRAADAQRYGIGDVGALEQVKPGAERAEGRDAESLARIVANPDRRAWLERRLRRKELAALALGNDRQIRLQIE